MHLVNLIRTASPEANLLASLSAFTLVIKIIFFNAVPEIFPGAYELGVVSEAVLASVVASYIFYLIVVHVKEQKDRSKVKPYILKHVRHIVNRGVRQLQAIERESKINLNIDSLDQNSLSSALVKIPPYSAAPFILASINKEGNWIQYLGYDMQRTRKSIKRLLGQLLYIDAELVALLTAIDDCLLFSDLDFFTNVRLENDSIVCFCGSFYEYFTLCKSLNAYLESFLSNN